MPIYGRSDVSGRTLTRETDMWLIIMAFVAGMATSALIAARLCVQADRRDDAEVEAVARALFRTDGHAR
jgi:hypothetical protein